MSPPLQDHQPFPTTSLSHAAHQVNEHAYAVARDEAMLRASRHELCVAMLDGVLDAGMSRASLARLTGYSRRQVGRMLREATAWADELPASTGSSLTPFPNL